MRLLLTGASGFIGRHVLLQTPKDWVVFGVYNQSTDLPAFLVEHALSHVRPVACDLTSVDEIQRLAEVVGDCDACVYLAANGDPALSVERAEWDLRLNTVALVNVLERIRVGRMVYMSSGAVYDGLSGEVTPSTRINPRLPYAISKMASEHYVASFAARGGAPASFANVRFFGAYGPYEPSRKITTRWLRAIAEGQRQFTIRGDGRNLIDLMHVDDAAAALLTLLADTTFSGTLDLAGGSPMPIDDVVKAMGHALGVEVSIRHEGTVPEYIEFRTIDRTMRERFGFSPAIPFDAGVRRLHAFLNQPARA